MTGPLHPGDPTFAPLGFTPEAFSPDSYLFHDADAGKVWCSLMMATEPGHGAFGAFVRACEGAGYRIVVPNALPRMEAILKRWGFVPRETPDGEEWRRPA